MAKTKDEEPTRTRSRSALCAAVLASLALPGLCGTELESRPAFVFLDPDTTSFWRTATNNVLTLPTRLPAGATKATVRARGLGYSREWTDIVSSVFTIELPRPDSLQTENVYDLELAFDNGVSCTAKVALVQGQLPDAEGATRCLAPAGGRVWNRVKGRAVIPVPYGAGDVTVTVDGQSRTEETGLFGAKGWYAIDVGSGESVSLSFVADGHPFSAFLHGPSGAMLLVR